MQPLMMTGIRQGMDPATLTAPYPRPYDLSHPADRYRRDATPRRPPYPRRAARTFSDFSCPLDTFLRSF